MFSGQRFVILAMFCHKVVTVLKKSYSVQCTMYCVHCTVYRVQCSVKKKIVNPSLDYGGAEVWDMGS